MHVDCLVWIHHIDIIICVLARKNDSVLCAYTAETGDTDHAHSDIGNEYLEDESVASGETDVDSITDMKVAVSGTDVDDVSNPLVRCSRNESFCYAFWTAAETGRNEDDDGIILRRGTSRRRCLFILIY